MEGLSLTQVYVAENVVLDARLALFHERESWLAIADLHYGFELSQRAAGRLVPFWGMASATTRVFELLDEYRPRRLILLGDLVHDHTALQPLRKLLEDVGERCELIAIAGNHDRKLRRFIELRDSFETDDFEFRHGHCREAASGRTQIIGHFHPAAILRDGAGLRLKLPAFVQEERCWILPAFSPWSAGTEWTPAENSRVWVCSGQRIFALAPSEWVA